MAKFLIHVTCGIENPSKAALAFLVATAAVKEGHSVTLFLASDAANLIRPSIVESLAGIGTGALKDHYAFLNNNNVKIYVSGMSAKARGLDFKTAYDGDVEFAVPDVLIKLSLEADRILSY